VPAGVRFDICCAFGATVQKNKAEKSQKLANVAWLAHRRIDGSGVYNCPIPA